MKRTQHEFDCIDACEQSSSPVDGHSIHRRFFHCQRCMQWRRPRGPHDSRSPTPICPEAGRREATTFANEYTDYYPVYHRQPHSSLYPPPTIPSSFHYKPASLQQFYVKARMKSRCSFVWIFIITSHPAAAEFAVIGILSLLTRYQRFTSLL